jgi:ureidoacrylate peracid hydrolase
MITIESRPEAMTVEPSQTALIVVDMQNDFGSEGGMFARAGIDITLIRGVIEPTAKVLAAARRNGIKVVYLKMAFRPDLSDAGLPDSPNWLKHLPLDVGEVVTAPDGSESRVLIRDTWNTEIINELAPEDEDIVRYKHRFSGFYETDLDATLRRLGVKNLILTGCTTSVCVESTLRDAMFRDNHCLLLEDCTAEPIGSDLPRSNHDASVLVTQVLFGWTANSQDLLKALKSQSVPAETSPAAAS